MKKILTLFLFLILSLGTAIGAKDHYLERAVSDSGDITIWGRMPISVYVQKSPYYPEVIQAFQTWQSALGGIIKFTLAKSSQSADIKVTFANNLPNGVAGLASKQTSKGKITSCDIQLLNPPYTQVSKKSMSATALHEIGHALGINGHSPSKTDIMYPTSAASGGKLSSRDIMTVKWLYKVDQKTLDKHEGYLRKSKILEAEAYVKKYPNATVGWNNLALAYAENKMYDKAELAYKRALKINPKAFAIYRNLSILYAQQKKYSSAFNAAKKYYQLNPNEESLEFLINLIHNSESRVQARQIFNAHVKRYPSIKKSSKYVQLRKRVIYN